MKDGLGMYRSERLLPEDESTIECVGSKCSLEFNEEQTLFSITVVIETIETTKLINLLSFDRIAEPIRFGQAYYSLEIKSSNQKQVEVVFTGNIPKDESILNELFSENDLLTDKDFIRFLDFEKKKNQHFLYLLILKKLLNSNGFSFDITSFDNQPAQ